MTDPSPLQPDDADEVVDSAADAGDLDDQDEELAEAEGAVDSDAAGFGDDDDEIVSRSLHRVLLGPRMRKRRAKRRSSEFGRPRTTRKDGLPFQLFRSSSVISIPRLIVDLPRPRSPASFVRSRSATC